MDNNKSFESLEAWKSARELRQAISKMVKKFPEHEANKLTDQILRSSRSVSANIAEGYGRFHYLDNMRMCRIARGSLTETLEHLICANDEEYISETELFEMKMKYERSLRLLNGYVAFLKSKKEAEKSERKARIT